VVTIQPLYRAIGNDWIELDNLKPSPEVVSSKQMQSASDLVVVFLEKKTQPYEEGERTFAKINLILTELPQFKNRYWFEGQIYVEHLKHLLPDRMLIGSVLDYAVNLAIAKSPKSLLISEALIQSFKVFSGTGNWFKTHQQNAVLQKLQNKEFKQQCEFLLFPINPGAHWFLGVLNVQQQRIEYVLLLWL
jgi:hypothetical protein